MARRTRFHPFKPYRPPPIPAGSYDPALDAQRRSASRGLIDVTQDTETANRRATIDYGLGVEGYNRQRSQTLEDYGTNTRMLGQAFQNLASQQTSQAAGANVLGGGALLQAAAKRAANQTQQQGQLDLRRDRGLAEIDVNKGLLAQGFERQGIDSGTALERARREDTSFGLDVESQKAFQAAQMGYAPPQPGEPGGMPRGEFTNRNGVQRRRIVKGGVEYIVAPDGTVVRRRRVR